jgi:hypothetical protein
VIHHTFGYREDTPSLRNLLIRLLVTDYAAHVRGDVPQAFAHLLLPRSGHANAVVCLAQWRDSSSKGSSYDLLSAEVARILKIEEHVAPLDIEQLLDVMTFLDVEKLSCVVCEIVSLHTVETSTSRRCVISPRVARMGIGLRALCHPHQRCLGKC